MSEVRNIKEGERINSGGKRSVSTKIDFDFRSSGVVRILLILLAVFAVVFCIYQVTRANLHQKKMKTETALMKTISKSITAEGFVLREEAVIPYDGSGTVVPEVDNGSKVAVGDTVAKAYGAQTAAQDSIRYAALQEELQYYEELSSFEADTVSVGMELYNQNILKQLYRLEEVLDDNSLSSLSSASKALGSDVTKKQIAVGKGVNLENEISQLKAEMSGLAASLNSCMELTAQQAGFYVNETDGYESVGSYADVAQITPEGVSQLLAAQPSAARSGVGKLITQFTWYLVCKFPSADVQDLSVGDKVKVTFSEYADEEIEMKIAAINGGLSGEIAVVFSSDLMDRRLAKLRVETVRVRTEEYTGFAVNKDAVREVDGSMGVYIQLGNLVKFRKIEILYSDENVILAENKDENGYLRLYDEIIIEDKELTDGQIVS